MGRQGRKVVFFGVDVVEVLTDSKNPTDYIKKMKKRDPQLAEGWGQFVTPLSMETAGGKQRVNCAHRHNNERMERFHNQTVQEFQGFEKVKSFPDKCGKFQEVNSFPDIKIQIVNSFPDLKVKEVSSFPGF